MPEEARVRALRWRAQHLELRDGGDPAAVVRAIGAVQSQDPAAAALALRARGTGFDAAEVERVRVEDRTVVRTRAHRDTIHLVPTEDVRWVQRLLAPAMLAKREGRYRAMGLEEDLEERAVGVLRAALADGPLTAAEIGERWAAAGIDASGYRLPHLISRAQLTGEICDGPDRGRERTWVRLADWVEAPEGPEGEAALAELARRHLTGHGPAEPRDLAAWSGLKVSEARAAYALLGDALEPFGSRWVLAGRGDLEPQAGGAVVRLLGGFDAYLQGYADRALAVPAPYTKAVTAGGLRVLPAVAVDGRVVGTWKLKRRAKRIDVEPAPFEDLDRAVLAAEIADLGRFLGVSAA